MNREHLRIALRRRPANAVNRLGAGSSVLIVTPESMVGASNEDRGCLLTAMVSTEEGISGVLRAAKKADAVVGLTCPPGEMREGASQFFEAISSAAEEVGHVRPFFVQSPPVELSAADGRGLSEACALAQRFVDAGFTSLCIDASRLAFEQMPQACAEVSQVARELELSIEVAFSRGHAAAAPDALRQQLEEMESVGLIPSFIRLSPAQLAAERAQLPVALRHCVLIAHHRGVKLSVVEEGALTPGMVRWGDWGAKKTEVREAFSRTVLGVLPSGGFRAKALADLEESARDRVEALCYDAASEYLVTLEAVGSATRVMAAWAETAKE